MNHQISYTFQEGGGIIDWFKNFKKRKQLKVLKNIFNKMKDIKGKFKKPEHKLKIYVTTFKKLLEKHTEEIDTLMYRYQELVMFEKKKSYIQAMSEKSPKQTNDPDFYESQLKALDVQFQKVNNYITIHEKNKETKSKEFEKTRIKIENEKKQLEKNGFSKMKSVMKDYSNNADIIEKVRIEFEKYQNYMQNKMKGEDEEITKERAESKRYYNVFKSFFINRPLVDEA
jgi:hypothetical protein